MKKEEIHRSQIQIAGKRMSEVPGGRSRRIQKNVSGGGLSVGGGVNYTFALRLGRWGKEEPFTNMVVAGR